MADHQVTVVAQIRAKDGMEEQVKQELMKLVGPTRSETGCINYDLHQSTENESLFMFYENWASKKDLDEHARTPHMKAHLQKARELFAEPPTITLWEMIR
ncbi:MAG TPA: putative quinol monooxygenase [Desulfatiglandales bacterium]|nr:putative quinol monooxygenase [Desulfatiglandales bacterium]